MPQKTTDQVYKDTEETARRGNVGLVTKVIERDGEAENFTNHECNVQLISRDEELKAIPVHVGRMGQIRVPAKGDFVEVSYLSGKTQSAYISGFAYSKQQRAPLGRQGHWRYRFGEESTDGPFLFLEAEPIDHQGVEKDFDTHVKSNPPNVLRMAMKETGLANPYLALELERNGSDGLARIRYNNDPPGGSVSPTDSYNKLQMGVDTAKDLAFLYGNYNDDEFNELKLELDNNAQTATIKGDPNADGTDEMEVGIDNANTKAYMEVDAGGDTVEITIDQSAGTIDILTEGQTVRIGDRNGTFKKVARKGDSVEVDGVASGDSTETGTITSGSSNVEST